MTTSSNSADLSALMSGARVPGLSMAIVRDGEIVSTTAAGVRNVSSGDPVGEHTIFDAASLSKPVFAYVVLQLVDGGALSLDAKLSRYVPDYVPGDPRAESITVRDVLRHTTGLPNWRSAARPLKTYFVPGERYSYSGEGFIWLQAVVEKITGQSLDDVARRLVFDPLGMRETSYVWRPDFDADYADPHDAALVPGRKTKPIRSGSAYSLQTTATDFARFLQAVLAGARLTPETARLWLEPQVRLRRSCTVCLDGDVPDSDQHVAWGFGWGLEPDSGTFFQWGDNDRGRYKAFVMGSMRERSGVAVFTNGFGGMAIMPALVGEVLAGPHPAFDWLDYPRYDPGGR